MNRIRLPDPNQQTLHERGRVERRPKTRVSKTTTTTTTNENTRKSEEYTNEWRNKLRKKQPLSPRSRYPRQPRERRFLRRPAPSLEWYRQ